MKKMSLTKYIKSNENIYLAIYAVKSFVFEAPLLDKKDKELLNMLLDPFNEEIINQTIEKVRDVLISVLKKRDKLFEVQVYFKPKDYKDDKPSYRPIHTASLITLIAMVAMLHPLIYEIPTEDNDWKLNLSNYSRLIPNNFYGNRVSKNPEELFKKWGVQYKKYTQKANEHFNTYRLSNEYRYELKLDLKNFFPSIDPLLIFQILMEHIPVSFSKNDVRTFKTIIYKLLVCKITNLNTDLAKDYYYGTTQITSTLTKGIPQGLPQSYFLGNMCMIEISKIFEDTFGGESVYYVDDSYIYTNFDKNLSAEIFSEEIKELNNKIKNMVSGKIKSIESKSIFNNKDYLEFFKSIGTIINKDTGEIIDSYLIEVHESGKSTFTDIQQAKEGEVYLKALSREASQIGCDINSAYSEEEELSALNRTRTLLKAIIHEKKDACEENNYKEKLVRYYKFFKYRELKLRLKSENAFDGELNKDLNKNLTEILTGDMKDESENIESALEKYITNEESTQKEKFFENYKQDIWQVALDIIINNRLLRDEQIKDYINKIIKLAYNDSLEECSYIKRMYANYLNNKTVNSPTGIYTTLDESVKRKMARYSNLHSNLIKKEFCGVRLKALESQILSSFEICSNSFIKICRIVNANSQRLKRMVLNAIYSKIFNITLSDDVKLSCYDKKGITYGVFRTMIYIRNANFDTQEFFKWQIDIMSPENSQKIDYTIFEVIDAYKKYVITPKNIDDLILIHKYTCDVWKNGAKHLYFYTLHNQEHAIDLIKNIIKIIKTFSYLKITHYDYYILFMACYLHDISMVRIASKNDFLLENTNANEIITQSEQEWKNSKTVDKIKKSMLNTYIRLDEFFENKIRSNHARDSAKEIRFIDDLAFIEPSTRENIAEIAESHMMSAKDIYYLKGDANNKLISYKFDKILLRLADLLDMSEHRVSKPILNHNLDNMSSLSAFHWVSHLLTEGYCLTSQYLSGDSKDALAPGAITENVTLTIRVNLSQLSKTESRKCKYAKIEDETVKNSGFELTLLHKEKDREYKNCEYKPCDSKKCNFLCRWFNEKNAYLVEELNALEAYLNRLPDKENFYKTSISIKVAITQPTNLTDEQFEILKNKIK
jgi:hypothetical protein